MDNSEWLICPACASETWQKVREDTILENFLLFCPKCRQETLINVEKFNISAVEITEQPTPAVLTHGNLVLSAKQRKVFQNGQEIYLTHKEFDLLHLLLQNRGWVLTYEQIFVHVWGEKYYDSTINALTVLISRLRRKLKIDCLKNVHDMGYRLDI